MALEQEIKLALPAAQIDAARRTLTAYAGAAGREISLSNIYFDTPLHALAHARSALRLRQTPQGWQQAFKTAGSVAAGLHRRHEWEMPVAGAQLDLAALLALCEVPTAAEALRQAAPQLIPLFRTDFSRTLWQVTHAGAMIEAALDHGAIIAQIGATTRRAPLCEIELELISGDETTLQTLATRLTTALPELALDNSTKAQRGYQLCIP